jgi:hypothetical protein
LNQDITFKRFCQAPHRQKSGFIEIKNPQKNTGISIISESRENDVK